MIRLSKRLQTVAHQVQSGGVVADIGCDHGFTSVYLVEQGLAERVIAMDINEGPLERAKEHIRQYNMQSRIETRLSDGAGELLPGEAETLLISGMGGALICRILSDSPEVVRQAEELVLSPQSELSMVRHFLQDTGYCIDREEMLQEQGKYYVVLHAVPGSQNFTGEEEYIYGKYLIDRGDACLLSFLEKEENRLQRILQRMEQEKLSPAAALQRAGLEEQLRQVRRTMAACQGQR